MSTAKTFWDGLSSGQKWVVVGTGAVVTLATGGAAAVAVAKYGVIVEAGTFSVTLGKAAMLGGAAMVKSIVRA